MVLWQPAGEAATPAARGLGDDGDDAPPTWRRLPAALLGMQHSDDVLDLAWAPDGSARARASLAPSVLVAGVREKKRGEVLARLLNHKHFVQGAAWDPAGQYLVTQGADRTCRCERARGGGRGVREPYPRPLPAPLSFGCCAHALAPPSPTPPRAPHPPTAPHPHHLTRVYSLKDAGTGRKTKVSQYLLPAADAARDLYCSHVLAKRAGADGAKQPLFLDEGMGSFFRRLAWSPEGARTRRRGGEEGGGGRCLCVFHPPRCPPTRPAPPQARCWRCQLGCIGGLARASI